MLLNYSCDPSFERALNKLKKDFPKELFDMDGIGKQLDFAKFTEAFFSDIHTTADVSVDSNSNVADKSSVSFPVEAVKPFMRLEGYHQLWKGIRDMRSVVKANQLFRKMVTGELYVNDLHGASNRIPYCFNYSCYDIMTKGLTLVDRIDCEPPKYLSAFKSQLEQFVTVASNATLGATGLADFLIVVSMYAKRILANKKDAHFNFVAEEDCWNYIDETITSFIYTVNQNMRGSQSPFTNISLYDKHFLANLCGDYIDPITLEEADPELVLQLQSLFINIMNRELQRATLTFPVTSSCFYVKDGEIQDKSYLWELSRENLKFGFMNFYFGDTSTLSSCCRLRSETTNEYFNSFGAGGSSKIGSSSVVTINLPRPAYVARDFSHGKEIYLKEVAKLATECCIINHARRNQLLDAIESGRNRIYSDGFIEVKKQYITTGFNGLNEAVELMGMDIRAKEGTEFALEILNTINKANAKYAKKHKLAINMEQVPAENVSVKLADKDRLLGFNTKYDLYSNQFIPLTSEATLLDRIRLQGVFDKHCSGGAIAHLNVGNELEKTKDMYDLLVECAKRGVIYVAVNYRLAKCANKHVTATSEDTCPKCGAEITNRYIRVVGFLVDEQHMHEVRREKDIPNRIFYDEIAV